MKGFLNLILGAAIAANSNAAFAATEPTLPVMSTLVSLLVVLAAIGVVAFVVKRISGGGSTQARMMRVVSQLPVGAREKISIVEIDDQWLVLGVTAQQITLLAQTPKKDIEVAPLHNINFSTLLSRARGKHHAN
ncbi:MAG: flagellar biosynthetic protein FliO [Usitatibacteraceae bacterium]